MVIEDWVMVESELKLRGLMAEAARERLARPASRPRRPARVVLARVLRAIAGWLDGGARPAGGQQLAGAR